MIKPIFVSGKYFVDIFSVDYPGKFNIVFFNIDANPVISYFDSKGVFVT